MTERPDPLTLDETVGEELVVLSKNGHLLTVGFFGWGGFVSFWVLVALVLVLGFLGRTCHRSSAVSSSGGTGEAMSGGHGGVESPCCGAGKDRSLRHEMSRSSSEISAGLGPAAMTGVTGPATSPPSTDAVPHELVTRTGILSHMGTGWPADYLALLP